MKIAILSLFAALVLASAPAAPAAEAAGKIYKIYMKSGSVITGVTAVEKTNGTVRVLWKGGYLGFSEDEIEKIEVIGVVEEEEEEETAAVKKDRPSKDISTSPPHRRKPVKKELKKKPSPQEVKLDGFKSRLAGIDKRLAALEKEESDAGEFISEYNTVRLRIENLYGIGRRKAALDGAPASQYQKYLTKEEKQMLQSNFIKKNQMKQEAKEAKGKLESLAEEKRRLLDEKRSVKDEIRELGL